MPIKRDMDATTGTKLLKLFQRLMLDGRRHFQTDLADWLNCSKQTIIRLTGEIEGVIGASMRTGLEQRRRWYQICPQNNRHLGLDFEELRYMRICRELASPYLPEQIGRRVDDSIFRFSLLMADAAYLDKASASRFSFFSKGRIDYTPHFAHIEELMQALEEKRICLVRYKAAGQNTVKVHRFAPGRMVSMNNALYVLGADVLEDFKTMRHLTSLAVHRIQNVTQTDKPIQFEIPQADLGMFGLPWHEPRTYRIRFKPGKVSDYIRERVWSESQKLVEMKDGGVLLQIITGSEIELESWIKSFGDNIISYIKE